MRLPWDNFLLNEAYNGIILPMSDSQSRSIPKLFLNRVRTFTDRKMFYYQDDSKAWRSVSWSEVAVKVARRSQTLKQQGVKKGDTVAILSYNCIDWIVSDLAILSLGGVTVGIYVSSTPEQVRYILRHSGAVFMFVGDEELLSVATLALTTAAVSDDASNTPLSINVLSLFSGDARVCAELPAHVTCSSAATLEEELARDQAQIMSDWEQDIHSLRAEDIASLIYTSGTTGPPKGVVLKHRNFVDIANVSQDVFSISEDDVTVLFLPMAHSLQRLLSYACIHAGIVGYYAEDMKKLIDTVKHANPTFFVSVPRVYEKVHAKILEKADEASPLKKKLFNAALKVGIERSRLIQKRESVPLTTELAYQAFDKLVFSKIRANVFGSRIRHCVSGGAPIGRDLLEFFHAIGVLILEGYGLTETSAPATLNHPRSFKFGSVGRALPGTEIKIADDGEILIKGMGVFEGYYKNSTASKQVMRDDGWFHSGDIGEIDYEGFLRITDRKKDIIVTAGGKNVAPQNIENLLKLNRYVSQAMVHGDQRAYLVALITLDKEQIDLWAHQQGGDKDVRISSDDHQLIQLVEHVIQDTNKRLARYENVRKFRILQEDFTIENGMLTPTMKVKRRVVEEKYSSLLDSMYG